MPNGEIRVSTAGSTDEAVNAWQKSVEADATLTDAVFNLADALQQAERFDESRPLWRAYLRLDTGGEWHDYACACLDPAFARG